MSADNGLVIRKESDDKWVLSEYDASTGAQYWQREYPTFHAASIAAQEYAKENIVEYGISFNI